MASGTLYIIAAPSGTGKTSLVGAVLDEDPNVSVAISHTTRPKRPGEENGIHYHFVSKDEFAKMREKGEFMEHANVFGNEYGTRADYVKDALARGTDVILEIDWQGAKQIAQKHECVQIYILPPSKSAVKERLISRRQDSPEVIAERLKGMATEVSHVGSFDYIVVNKDFNRAKADILAIIRANRLRRSIQSERHAGLIADLIDS